MKPFTPEDIKRGLDLAEQVTENERLTRRVEDLQTTNASLELGSQGVDDEVRSALGLPRDAKHEAVLAKIRDLRQTAETALALARSMGGAL